MCIITQNFVVIGQAAGQIWQFIDFLQNGSCLPSCLMHTRITYKEYLGLYRCAKFGWSRCSRFHNMKILIFCMYGSKIHIHAWK